MNHYLSQHPNFADKKINDNDKDQIHQEYYQKCKDLGMPEKLASHYAHIFASDPLMVFPDHLNYDENSTEHFENLNGTHWPSVRFKPPPGIDTDIGWRTEFRTLDVQITDYENTAYITLLNLLVRVLTDFDINVSLPISL